MRSCIIIFLALCSFSSARNSVLSLTECESIDENVLVGDHGRAFAIDISPDFNTLAVSNDQGISLYDLETLTLLETLTNDDIPFGGLSIAWSPNGENLASFVAPEFGVQIWDIATKDILQNLELPNEIIGGNRSWIVHTLKWSNNGNWLVAAGNFPGLIWDVVSQAIIFEFDQPAAEDRRGFQDVLHTLATWSLDSSHLAISEINQISIWDTTTWSRSLVLDINITEIYSLDWSENGFLAVAGEVGNVEVRDTENWDIPPLYIETSSYSTALAWSPEGTELAIGGYSLDILDTILWKTNDLTMSQIMDPLLVYDIKWVRPSNEIIVRSRDHAVYKWNLQSKCLTGMILPPEE